MASTADWVPLTDILLLQHSQIDWTTGSPIWIYSTHDRTGRRVEQRFAVTVHLKEII